MKPVIIHISSDYPDTLNPDKTRAVASLVDGTPEFRHVVYSLNRVNGFAGISSIPFGPDKTAVAFRALPKGLLWERRLDAVGKWIINDLITKGIKPDLVEAHKFALEGIVAEQVRDHFNVPLVCDIQGDSDTKIIAAKISLRPRYKALAKKTSLFLPYSHWPLNFLRDKLAQPKLRYTVLPVVPGFNGMSPAPVQSGQNLVTVLNIDSWPRKNIAGLMEAIKILRPRFPHLKLDVYGRGKASALLKLDAAIRAMGLSDTVILKGSVPNGTLTDVLKSYAGMVLPSLRETFGLVYTEALFAGLPILYSKDRGFDGFFAADKIGYACNPNDAADIAQGMAHILDHEAALKQSITNLQETGAFDILRRDTILQTYRDNILNVLKEGNLK